MSSSGVIILYLNDVNVPPKTLNGVNVSFGTPEVLDDGGDYNTNVRLDAVPGKGYYGFVQLHYNREQLSALGDTHIQSTTGFTKQMIVDTINSLFSAQMETDDIEDPVIPEIGLGETATVKIIAKSESLGWVGEVDLEFEYAKTALNVIVRSKDLSVLQHSNIYYKSQFQWMPIAKFLSNDMDFTAFRDYMKPDPNGRMIGVATIQTVMAKLGFPGFRPLTMGDYATSQVPDSNQEFDRVVVLNIETDNMLGPIYLHYNNLDGA